MTRDAINKSRGSFREEFQVFVDELEAFQLLLPWSLQNGGYQSNPERRKGDVTVSR